MGKSPETRQVSSEEEDDEVGAFITSIKPSAESKTSKQKRTLNSTIKTQSYIPEVLPGSFDEKSNPFTVFENPRVQQTEQKKTEMKSALKPPSQFAK